MSKFHINPETGVINRCHATSLDNCPYGGEAGDANHFDSIKEGRAHYERVMDSKLINSMRKDSNFTEIKNKEDLKDHFDKNKGADDSDLVNAMRNDPNFTEIKTKEQLREQLNEDNEQIPVHEDQLSLFDDNLNPIENNSAKDTAPKVVSNDVPKPVQKNAVSEDSLNGDFSKIGQRDLNRMVKDAKNEDLMMEAANRGSERVLASLVNNPNASADSLVKVLERSDDKSTKRSAMQHRNYPVSKLSVEDFNRTLTNDNKNYRFASDDITDEHVKQALNYDANNTSNIYSVHYNSALKMISNPNNKVSAEVVQQVINDRVNSSYQMAQYGIPSEKIDLKRTMDNLPSASQASYLTRFAENKKYENEAVDYLNDKYSNTPANRDDRKDLFRAAKEITLMDNISGGNIERLSATISHGATDEEKKSYEYQEYQKSIISNTNKPNKTRDRVMAENPQLAGFAKAVELRRNHPEELESLTTPISRRNLGRSYNENTFQVDKEKAARLGLDDEAIIELYKHSYNAGFHYDSETGIITGRVDSSD